MELLQNFYETTLEVLKDAENDRLLFKTTIELGKLCIDRRYYDELKKILEKWHQLCQVSDVNVLKFE